jgi:hypothetical protein
MVYRNWGQVGYVMHLTETVPALKQIQKSDRQSRIRYKDTNVMREKKRDGCALLDALQVLVS